MSLSVTIETGQRVATIYGPWQYDYGQTLTVSGLNGLPEAVPVHFAVEGATTATTMLGRFADGALTVDIPDAMLQQPGAFWAYLYEVINDTGQTVTGVKFLPYARPAPEDEVTTDQQSAFDALVSELNVLIASVMQLNETATASAQAAAQSETNAAASEQNALTYKNAADGSATESAGSAQEASSSASAAASSEANAAGSAQAADQSAQEASGSAGAAKSSEDAAKASEVAASGSAQSAADNQSAAAQSAQAAAGSAQAAAQSEQNALSYKNAASSSAQAADASATAAASSATAASNSASAAANSEANAAGSASAAAASETNAASSATAAQAEADRAEASAVAAVQYTYVKYSAAKPASDADLKDSADENDQYMGIYTGPSSIAPTAYTSYAWIRLKGPAVRDARDNAVYDMAFTVTADGYPAVMFTQLA